MEKIEKLGKFRLLTKYNGGYSITGPGIYPTSGYHLPSRERIVERYRKDADEGQISETSKKWVGYIGGIEKIRLKTRSESFSTDLIHGREILGLEDYPIKGRPNPRIYRGVTQSEVKKAIKSFWNRSDVHRVLSGKNIQLPTILDFRRVHEREYHYITRLSERKGHKGKKGSATNPLLISTINKIYPGLFRHISKTLKAESINVEYVRDQVRERIYDGRAISKVLLRMTSSDALKGAVS